jgi:Na+/melibiose symporter-like transporter
VIVGALTSGALVDATSMNVLLALPAVAVTLCLFAIWFGVEDVPGEATGGFDWTGLALVTAALGLVMAGLVVVRLDGPGSLPVWLLILAGVAAVVPFARYEDARRDPIVDVRLMRSPGQWPVQLTAFLFGMSVLGAQIPLSTFARTDPAVAGYGLGADASFVSILVGLYVVFLAIGAFTLPVTSRLLGPRGALVLSALLVALGYALWLPFNDSTGQALVNMAVAGLGSGHWSPRCRPPPRPRRHRSAPPSPPA